MTREVRVCKPQHSIRVNEAVKSAAQHLKKRGFQTYVATVSGNAENRSSIRVASESRASLPHALGAA
jgi:hypothetical protein